MSDSTVRAPLVILAAMDALVAELRVALAPPSDGPGDTPPSSDDPRGGAPTPQPAEPSPSQPAPPQPPAPSGVAWQVVIPVMAMRSLAAGGDMAAVALFRAIAAIRGFACPGAAIDLMFNGTKKERDETLGWMDSNLPAITLGDWVGYPDSGLFANVLHAFVNDYTPPH